MILTDNETKVDPLNNEAIATTIIELLHAKPSFARGLSTAQRNTARCRLHRSPGAYDPTGSTPASGSTMLKVLPTPYVLATSTVPPWRSATVLTNARPSPMPCCAG